jgi:sialidase-1
LFALNWSIRNPDRVSCLYLDAPVCDFKSWPYGHGAEGADDWAKLLDAYGMTEAEALRWGGNPIDNLGSLAAVGAPILVVCGLADTTVPPDENALPLAERYRALGGSVTVIAKPFGEHHPHSLIEPTPIVNFILNHAGGAAGRPVVQPGTPNGYDYHVLRGGLVNSAARFEGEREGRVVFLGGSITNMNGWRQLVAEDLRQRFPDARIECINAGIPSFGSAPDAFRFSRDVLGAGRVDLLFVDAAVNDSTNGHGTVERRRAMEGIVRQARRANPAIDVVFLYFVDPEKMAEIREGRTAEVIADHERVAEAYGVPAIDLAREVTERIHAGEFDWDHDFRDLHPSPFGHAVYARSIGRLLDAAWGGEAAEVVLERPMPEPLDAGCFDRGAFVSVDAGRAGEGWTRVERWHPDDGVATRPGFVDVPALVSDTPGATVELPFVGTAAGVLVASGPDAGAIEWSIDGGPEERLDLYTQWSAQLHLPWALVPAAGLPDGRHTLRLRVAANASPKSTGHAVRILFFLVNGRAE